MNEQIIKKLDGIEAMLREILAHLKPEQFQEGDKHTLIQVEHYLSNSGNPTWRGRTDQGKTIYFRQSHRELLTTYKLWEQLNQMTLGDTWVAEITCYTVPDGDFNKPIRFDEGGRVFNPLLNGDTQPLPAASDLADVSLVQGNNELIEVVKSGNFLVLDTETAALHGEVVQIAVIDSAGSVLLDTLIKPQSLITDEAAQVHGISNDMVKAAPTYADLAGQLSRLLLGQRVLAWNASYDAGCLDLSAKRAGFPKISNLSTWIDAMNPFSQIFGEWSEYHQSYRWQKLTTAAAFYKISTAGAHSALADARMTLQVVKKMAGIEDVQT